MTYAFKQRFRFTLRRWPAESGLAVADPAPILEGVDGTIDAGNAITAVSASLRIAGHEQHEPLAEGAASVDFEVNLDTGPTTLQTWWHDEEGTPLAGAYYATVERL